MWDICPGEEADTTVVDAIAHPVDGECRLLLHLTFPRLEILHQNLLFSDGNDGIVHENRRATGVKVLLTEAPTITPICPENVQDHTGWMHGGMLVLGGGFFAMATFLDSLLGFDGTAAEA